LKLFVIIALLVGGNSSQSVCATPRASIPLFRHHSFSSPQGELCV